MKFLKDHNVREPMFNIYESGGYLMWDAWPLQKTFVDGRALNESVFQDYMKIAYYRRDADALLDKYGVQVLLLQGFEYWRGTVYLLNAVLADPAQTKWKLVYQDRTGMVFMRTPPPGVQALNPEEVFTSLDAQCTDHVTHEPGKPGCAVGLADLYTKLGRRERAADLARRLRSDSQRNLSCRPVPLIRRSRRARPPARPAGFVRCCSR